MVKEAEVAEWVSAGIISDKQAAYIREFQARRGVDAQPTDEPFEPPVKRNPLVFLALLFGTVIGTASLVFILSEIFEDLPSGIDWVIVGGIGVAYFAAGRALSKQKSRDFTQMSDALLLLANGWLTVAVGILANHAIDGGSTPAVIALTVGCIFAVIFFEYFQSELNLLVAFVFLNAAVLTQIASGDVDTIGVYGFVLVLSGLTWILFVDLLKPSSLGIQIFVGSLALVIGAEFIWGSSHAAGIAVGLMLGIGVMAAGTLDRKGSSVRTTCGAIITTIFIVQFVINAFGVNLGVFFALLAISVGAIVVGINRAGKSKKSD